MVKWFKEKVRQGIADAWREAPRKSVWGALAALAALVVWVASDNFDVARMWSDARPYWLGIKATIRPIVYDLAGHPVITTIGAALVGTLAGLAWVQVPRVRNLLRGARYMEAVGLRGYFHPQSKELPTSAAWELIKASASTPHGREHMRILGASGWNTFVKKEAPLYDVVRNYEGRLEIALLHPDSPFLADRAASVEQSIEVYRREIERTIRYVTALQKTNKSLDLRLYNNMPNWKLVMVGGMSLTQYYRPGEHVQDTPVVLWVNNGTDECAYQQFWWEFERIWRRCRPPTDHISEFYQPAPEHEHVVRLSLAERRRREDANRQVEGHSDIPFLQLRPPPPD